MCVITEPLLISPFDTPSSYMFRGSCDHYLLRACTGLEDFSITVDFTSPDLSSGRVGMRYGERSIVSTETGEVIVRNVDSVRTEGDAEIYDDRLYVYRENDSNRIEFHMTGIISILHVYDGSGIFIRVTVTDNFPITTCGLCGNRNGTLLHANLLTVASIDKVDEVTDFVNSYVVEPSQQYLRGQRRECGEYINIMAMSQISTNQST